MFTITFTLIDIVIYKYTLPIARVTCALLLPHTCVTFMVTIPKVRHRWHLLAVPVLFLSVRSGGGNLMYNTYSNVCLFQRRCKVSSYSEVIQFPSWKIWECSGRPHHWWWHRKWWSMEAVKCSNAVLSVFMPTNRLILVSCMASVHSVEVCWKITYFV